MNTNRKRIAIDIDGILTNETEGHNYEERTPNLAAIKLVKLLLHLGDYDVFLYTARWAEDKTVTELWLAKHGLGDLVVVYGKQPYDVLVDDRAI